MLLINSGIRDDVQMRKQLLYVETLLKRVTISKFIIFFIFFNKKKTVSNFGSRVNRIDRVVGKNNM